MASILDWKKRLGGAVMCLDVREDYIGLAIAKHPKEGNNNNSNNNSNHNDPPIIQSLTSINLSNHSHSYHNNNNNNSSNNKYNNKYDNKYDNNNSKELLEELVKQHSICGFVVGWPLLGAGDGRMGASCGKVLHTLDSLILPHHNTNTISINRPFTLLDTRPTHHTNNNTNNDDDDDDDDDSSIPDKWGRSVTFSRVPSSSTRIHHHYVFKNNTTSNHNNNNNNSHSHENMSASLLLDQFIKDHWQLHTDTATSTTNQPTNVLTPHRRKDHTNNHLQHNNNNNNHLDVANHQSPNQHHTATPISQQIDNTQNDFILSQSLL